MDKSDFFGEEPTCFTSLLEFFEEEDMHMGRRDLVDIVGLDFQKAFDKVWKAVIKIKLPWDKRKGLCID